MVGIPNTLRELEVRDMSLKSYSFNNAEASVTKLIYERREPSQEWDFLRLLPHLKVQYISMILASSHEACRLTFKDDAHCLSADVVKCYNCISRALELLLLLSRSFASKVVCQIGSPLTMGLDMLLLSKFCMSIPLTLI